MRYNTYSDYLKKRYGKKVYKLPISIPVTCPNRDGSCGTGGCIFCGEIGAGYENLPASMSITEQIANNKQHIIPKYKAELFIPYFQNFSNTYLKPERLERYLYEACAEDVVGIAIATRPDCISDEYLELFAEVRAKKKVDIFVELGLQTVNYRTLEKIRRGHSLAEYIDAAFRLHKYTIPLCTHLILNLPWDDMADVIESAKIISAVRSEQVKLHALYVVKNTKLAELYEHGLELVSREEYIERVITFLEYLQPDAVLQRLIGRAPEVNTLFSNWHTGWWKIRDMIEDEMERRDTFQGRKCDYLNGKAVQKFL